MAKGDSSPGLLSKVAQFVRHPTRDWAALDAKEEVVADSGFSKEVLRQMIERKRQNDFVRKREFDYLRKLRRRESLNNSDPAGRPSFFQSSLPTNPDERAMTLKKIDEIEAQMSRQWWQGKQDEGAARVAGFPMASQPLLGPEAGPTQPLAPTEGAEGSRFPTTQSSLLLSGSNWFDVPEEYALTRMDLAAYDLLQSPSATSTKTGAATDVQAMGTGFSRSRTSVDDAAEQVADPELEEAAIRYANGDLAGAESVLWAALQEPPPVSPTLAYVRMMALLDLYRATGQQVQFERVALDFAKRLGRSPPDWFSMPERLASPVRVAAPIWPRGMDEPAAWTCPDVLHPAQVESLQRLTLAGPGPWVLDWQPLKGIAPEAVASLLALCGIWAQQPVQLVLRGHEALRQALRTLTRVGEHSQDRLGWQLHMEVLRILRLQDVFEQVALDYCVTYEMSPPSWMAVTCHCVVDGQGETGEVLPGACTEPVASDDQGAVPRPALVGELQGDASALLAALERALQGDVLWVIACDRLTRVDFSAAGSILNWVSAQQARGHQVCFQDVNRIVAAFFQIIGINEHALIVPRSN